MLSTLLINLKSLINTINNLVARIIPRKIEQAISKRAFHKGEKHLQDEMRRKVHKVGIRIYRTK